MPRRWTMVTTKSSVDAAFDTAKGDIESLKDEMREWADNLEGAGTGLENTSKYQAIDETASSLEEGSEKLEAIDLPDSAKAAEVSFTEYKDTKARWRRLSNALAALDAVKEYYEEQAKAIMATEPGEVDAELAEGFSEIASEIEEAKDNLDGVDFPGMYG